MFFDPPLLLLLCCRDRFAGSLKFKLLGFQSQRQNEDCSQQPVFEHVRRTG